MLLATVLDSFCIDNTVTIAKKPIAFGKLMGAYTFFFQDFPQLTIHLYFLIFMHDEASLILHAHPLVLVSLVVSCFAVAISLFNFVMFKNNDFDPLVIEVELFRRKRRLAKSIKPEDKANSRDKFKRKMSKVGEENKVNVPSYRKRSLLYVDENILENENSKREEDSKVGE